MKIAVIGTGSMGRNHVRVLRNMKAVKETAIADIDEESLSFCAKRFGIEKTYNNYLDLLDNENPDGVIIATESENHKRPVIDSMSFGAHVLVEKPIATDISDAEEMIEAAKKADVVFTVGHTERFNPVILKIKELIDNCKLNNIYMINTRRIGPFPKRLYGKEDGVLIDLAVHDFDIIHYLCGKIIRMESQIINGNNQEVYVRTLMDVENNVKASSEFSWISPRRVRTIEIYGGSGMIMGDYFSQEARFYQNSDYKTDLDLETSFLQSGLINYGRVVKCSIDKQEPLFLELSNFIKAIKGSEDVFIQPEEAILALKDALRLKDATSKLP